MEEEVEEKKYKSRYALKIIYLIILIILLILAFGICFKTGENLYKLVNTDMKNKNTQTETGVADWSFRVRIY